VEKSPSAVPQRDGLFENHPQCRRIIRAGLYRRAYPARHSRPGPQPQQRQRTKHPERRAPAEVRHQQASHDSAHDRSGQISSATIPLAVPKPLAGTIAAKYFRGAWETGALAQAEQQPQHQKHGEGVRESDQDGGRCPQGESGREYSVRTVALGEPAYGNLRKGIRPEKGGHQHAHLRVVQVQIALHQVRRRGQSAPRST